MKYSSYQQYYLIDCATKAALSVLVIGMLVASSGCVHTSKGRVTTLITETEAISEEATSDIFVSKSLNGPRIDVMSPNQGEKISPPVRVAVKFSPGATGSEVDPSTFKLTYHKLIPIDLTDRVKEFVTNTGIDAKNVSVPSGKHKISVKISDMSGNTSVEKMVFEVAKN